MTYTICFWALLSQKDLSFVYLSPWLSKTLGAENDLLLGTSFFDYFHPEEQEFARHDLSELVKKKTISCSVTRCQYNTIQTIRKRLQQSMVSSKSSFKQMPSQYSPASSTMTSPNFTPIASQTIQRSNDDEYIVMDVGMNVVSQDIVLACFHSDDVKQSNSNGVSGTCGETEFTKEEVNKLTSLMRKHLANKVQTPPSTPFPENFYNNETPNRIFQILDRKSRTLIFTWPDSNSNISYNKYDFSRLIFDSNTLMRNNSIKKTDVESPNCLRLMSDKHIILTSGIYRQVESVIIPYGDIIFACFQILPSASTMLGVSSAFSKPKARSAPCSPATTINNNNNFVKRPRSPGSLSPLPSSYFYDDEIKRCHHSKNSSFCNQEVPDFILENRSFKRHRIDDDVPSVTSSTNDSSLLQHFVPVKISSSPPNTPRLLLNPISPSYHDRGTQPQFPFPQNTISKDQQPPPTIQHPQQPYYSHITPPPPPQSRQLSPKQQQDYPSPTNHSSFQNIITNNNNNNNNNMTQPHQSSSPPSQSSPSNQSQQRFTQFTPQSRRNNNSNNNNNNNNNVQGVKKCESCHTSSSPEWRRGPTGHKTLCNACGLRYSRTIARENRKREQAQREQEQRQREQREREERALERATTVIMQRPYQYRTPNAPSIPVIAPSQQHQHHQTTSTHPSHPSSQLQYHPSTLPPISYHHHHQPQVSHHHHHHHNIRPAPISLHHQQIDLPPPSNNDRIGYTLPPPLLFDRQQNGTNNGNSYQIPGSR
ncbi:hypothetical protein C1645_820466 [Glomus cerebriforme]|uniref:GATA-type domain-containing protein n=1 Tax=Glomus cerebriforme TaxID=658196 RepID=A0A397T2D8_9GLOM|nr:hypothetical protein C1645_820466 [Glomus cerebriforme]